MFIPYFPFFKKNGLILFVLDNKNRPENKYKSILKENMEFLGAYTYSKEHTLSQLLNMYKWLGLGQNPRLGEF